MSDMDSLIDELEDNRTNIRFERLKTICERFFGKPRGKATSHVIYKMPWSGDPRINLQKGKGGKAKPYQVDGVVKALRRLKDVLRATQKNE